MKLCIRTTLIAAWLAMPLATQGQTLGVDYTRLSSEQRAFFQAYDKCDPSNCEPEWLKLTSSEQLEFAGETQALSTVQLKTVEALQAVERVTRIHGSVPGQESALQFNVESYWKADAESRFKAARWHRHWAALHEGFTEITSGRSR